MKKDKNLAKIISRKKSRYFLTLSLLFVIGAIVGLSGALLLRNNNPTVLVWAANKDVKVPDGLVSYLEKEHKDDCFDYYGAGNPAGIPLFAIFEGYQNSLAKMTYGCSADLTSENGGYIVAYKEDGKWNLTEPFNYFSDLKPVEGTHDPPISLPNCEFIILKEFPTSFEPSCVNNGGVVVTR